MSDGRLQRVRAVELASPELSDALTGLSRQDTVYRRTVDVCDELADAVLAGADPAELTRVLATHVGKHTVLLDPGFVLRAESGGNDSVVRWDRSDVSIDRLLRALAVKRRPLRVPSVPGSRLDRGLLVTPIVVGDEVLGYLLVVDRPDDVEPDDVDLLTATYAATLFALTLAHERTTTELGQRHQRAVVDALVSGQFADADDATRKARLLGLVESELRIGVVRVKQAGAAGDVETIARRLATAMPDIVVAMHDPYVVLMLPESALTALRRSWQRFVKTTEGAATCGLSRNLAGPEQAPQGFRQAEQALDLGIRLGRTGQLVGYDDLGIYRLFADLDDLSVLWRFADDVLGSLVEYDDAHKADLVRTLSTYLRRHGGLRQVARDLHVHPNTVSYRARRIEQLTGLDLSDSDDRLVAHTAVKIVEAQRAGE